MSHGLEKDNQIEQIRRFQASHKIITILSQSKANIEYLIDSLPDIFAIINTDGYIAKGNNILATFMNSQIEDLLGQSIASLFTEITWKKFQTYLQEIGDNKTSIEFELPCDKIAIQKVLIWRISRFRHSNIIKPLYTLIGTDITALRQRENQLEAFNQNLQMLVDEKTRDITVLLNSVEQGIVSISPTQVLNETHSNQAETIFGRNNFSNTHFMDLFNLSLAEAKEFTNWFEMIKAPIRFARWKKYEPLCPIKERQIQVNGEKKVITIDYKPIIKGSQIDRLMVLCTDITEQRKAEHSLKESEKENTLQMQRVLSLVNNMPISISLFFEEISTYLDKFKRVVNTHDLDQNKEEFFRNAHTIKGNSGSFGFNELTKRASALEDILSQSLTRPMIQTIVEQFKEGVSRIQEEFQSIKTLKKSLSVETSNKITIQESEYQKLLEDCANNSLANDEIYRRIILLNSHPFTEYCHKYNNVIKIYREKYKKPILDLKIKNPDILVHRNIMAIFDVPLIHIIRNAIDHGIESEEERINSGKGPGLITIECIEKGNIITIIVSDDGRGINIPAVVEKAKALGFANQKELEKMDENQKIDLIFETGMTTKAKITSMSGRGTGLGAARAYITQHKGSMLLKSVVGRGCTFTLTIDKNTVLFK